MTRQIRFYDIALRTRFRSLDRREGVLIRAEHGWGEFSPFWDYDDQASKHWWQCAVEAADNGWPRPVRDRVEVNVTVPAIAADKVASLLQRAPGFRTAKVKVAQAGQSVGDEIERLEAVREFLGPDAKIRIDANGAWSLDEARRRLAILDRAAGGLEYAEQPVATIDELAQLRRATHVPIAADESIRRVDDPLRVKYAQAADIAVLKVQPLGGVKRCLQIAEQIELPVVVSSALETSIGLAAGVALAAVLPELPYACGLGTALLLERDVVARPLIADGTLKVSHAQEVIAELADSSAHTDRIPERWRSRLAAVGADVAGFGDELAHQPKDES